MLSKNCRMILKQLNKTPEPDSGFSTHSIAELTKLTDADCRRAVGHLVQEDYMKLVDTPVLPGIYKTFSEPRYILTENGACYKAIGRRAILSYIADKWIDIFASLISLAALIVSIITAIRSAG